MKYQFGQILEIDKCQFGQILEIVNFVRFCQFPVFVQIVIKNTGQFPVFVQIDPHNKIIKE